MIYVCETLVHSQHFRRRENGHKTTGHHLGCKFTEILLWGFLFSHLISRQIFVLLQFKPLVLAHRE